MGLMRLRVNDWSRIPEERLPRVFIAGPDELPYPGRTFRSGDQLVVERRDDSSGCLWAPWSQGERGEWLIGTTTLMEREAPYQLELELARGAVFRVRNQLETWRQLGLESTDELDAKTAEATRRFCRAATQQNDPAACSELAGQAIDAAADASLLLTSVYAKQAMEVRQAATERLPTLLGVGLGADSPEESDGPLAKSFSTVALRCSWSSIEASEGKRRWKTLDSQFQWAAKAGLRVCAGPLLEFSDRSIPDWAYLWEGDFEALAGLMIGHVENVVSRYRGRVQLWNVAGRINRSKALALSDEQRLQLVARAIRYVRENDPKTPVVVSFDQPWGEYLTAEPSELTPIDFADALERADLGIAGFGLELNIGYAPDGTSLRNPLDFSRLLDYWSLRLELPLMLSLALPSGAQGDPLASPKQSVVVGGVQGINGTPLASIDPGFQSRWVEQCLPMLLAKNCVQVVLWNEHRDDRPHLYPHSGLLDAEGEPKPALAALRQLREAHLV